LTDAVDLLAASPVPEPAGQFGKGQAKGISMRPQNSRVGLSSVVSSLPLGCLGTHEVKQESRINGLDKMLVESGCATAAPISVLTIACQCDKAAGVERRLLTQVSEQFVAVHDRQAY
jgi:hypothetical protein